MRYTKQRQKKETQYEMDERETKERYTQYEIG